MINLGEHRYALAFITVLSFTLGLAAEFAQEGTARASCISLAHRWAYTIVEVTDDQSNDALGSTALPWAEGDRAYLSVHEHNISVDPAHIPFFDSRPE